MKVLVIPDIHLKPHVLKRAGELMKSTDAEKAVCLMDLADDWEQELNLELYEETYDAAIEFAHEYPGTLWCWGNHDICYVWDKRESGYSAYAAHVVRQKVQELKDALIRADQLTFIHRIDNVLFMHGGLSDSFVRKYIDDPDHKDIDQIISEVNRLSSDELWQDDSPLWLRPQLSGATLYRADDYVQVTGHTPVKMIYRHGNLISTDVFSTYIDGTKIGSRVYLLINTETLDCATVS